MTRRARHLNARHAGAGLVLDARRLTGLNDGDAVSTWADVSGNGWNATGTSTARPLYKTAIQGGQPVLRFDGSNDYMSISSVGAKDYSKNVEQFCIISIAKQSISGADANNNLIYFSNVTGSARAGIFLKLTSDGSYSVARRLDADSFSASASAGVCSSFSVVRSTILFSSGSHKAAKNSIETSSTALSGSSSSSNSTSFEISIGSSSSGASSRLNGDIGAIYAFNSTLASSLVRRLEHSAAFSFKIQCS